MFGIQLVTVFYIFCSRVQRHYSDEDLADDADPEWKEASSRVAKVTRTSSSRRVRRPKTFDDYITPFLKREPVCLFLHFTFNDCGTQCKDTPTPSPPSPAIFQLSAVYSTTLIFSSTNKPRFRPKYALKQFKQLKFEWHNISSKI